MTHRTFDEQIANFNRVVSSWDINQEYKVALLGMIASLGYEHEKSITPEPHWIPVTERLPKSKEEDLEYPTVLICFENEEVMLGCFYESTKEWGTGEYFDKKCNPIAWMPLPEPYKEVTE